MQEQDLTHESMHTRISDRTFSVSNGSEKFVNQGESMSFPTPNPEDKSLAQILFDRGCDFHTAAQAARIIQREPDGNPQPRTELEMQIINRAYTQITEGEI